MAFDRAGSPPAVQCFLGRKHPGQGCGAAGIDGRGVAENGRAARETLPQADSSVLILPEETHLFRVVNQLVIDGLPVIRSELRNLGSGLH